MSGNEEKMVFMKELECPYCSEKRKSIIMNNWILFNRYGNKVAELLWNGKTYTLRLPRRAGMYLTNIYEITTSQCLYCGVSLYVSDLLLKFIEAKLITGDCIKVKGSKY